MKEMFTYMFKDKDFKKKALICFIFSFFSNLFGYLSQMFTEYVAPLSAISFIICMFTIGYFLLCTKHFIEKKEDSVIPEFDYFRCLSLSFKMWVSFFIFIALFILIVILSGLFIALPIGLFTSKAVMHIIIKLNVLILSFIFIVYYLAFIYILAKNEFFTSFVRLPLATKLIKQDLKNYFKIYGLLILLTIVIELIPFIFGMAFALTKNIYILISASFLSGLFGTYFIFIEAYLVSKSIKDNALTNID